MQTTQVATDIGVKDNANGICSLLSPKGQRQVASLLEHIGKELGNAVWCMPLSSLHITVCEIMQAKPYTEDKEVLFQRNQEQYKQALRAVISNVEPIKVIFNRVEVSPQAIIIRGNNDHVFDDIRKKLVIALPLPEQTKQPPTIIHSSIARFTKEIDLSIVEAAVAKLSVSFTEIVTEFQLMHNVSPHNLNSEVAARFPLKAQ